MPGAPVAGSTLAVQNAATTTTGRGGSAASVSQATADAANANTQAAPPNATAAAKNSPTFTGLCEALNTYQQNKVTAGTYEVADSYSIEFAPAALGDSKVKKPGNTDFDATPNQASNANGQDLNPATNSVDTTARTEPVLAGTQIIQFIDKVMRNSTYMSDQLLYITDEVTGKQVPSTNSKNGQTAWYKVSVSATPLAWDNKRRDHAYRMKYTISPYAINQMQSEYFPQARFRGLHKNYNYWFTGQNTEVLDFQQDYNNLYRLVISGSNVPILNAQTSDSRNITRRTAMAASAQSDQGAKKGANEPVANAADYLYSPSDQAKIKLRIAGDPAWMQQGEATSGVSAKTFNFSPFNPDGGINYDSQEVVFAINWNRPTDYNYSTGITDVNANNVTGTPALGVATGSQPQESFTYTAIKVKNTFAKGRFEQEVEGRLLVEYYDSLKSSSAQATAPGTANQANSNAALPNTSTTAAADATQNAVTGGAGTAADTTRQATRALAADGVTSTATSPTPAQNNTIIPVNDNSQLPMPPAGAPTSNGTVVYADTTVAPPTAGSIALQQQIQNVANAQQAGVNTNPQIENRST